MTYSRLKTKISKYAALQNENLEIENIQTIQMVIDLDAENEQIKIKPPQPIFIRGVLDLTALRTNLIKLNCVNNFFAKLITNSNHQIQLLRVALIKYLKEKKFQFYTY